MTLNMALSIYAGLFVTATSVFSFDFDSIGDFPQVARPQRPRYSYPPWAFGQNRLQKYPRMWDAKSTESNPLSVKLKSLSQRRPSPTLNGRSELDTRSGRMLNSRRCKVQPIELTIHPPLEYEGLCTSSTVLTFACRGGCDSYSRLNSYNTSQIERYCSCCSQTREGVLQTPAVIECKDGRQLRIPVKVALECNCRPCFSSFHHVDIFDLRRLLENSVMSRG